jgi:cytochrome c peroxidase
MKPRPFVGILLAWLALIWACSHSAEQKKVKKAFDDESVLAALPTEVPAPPDNPITPEKVSLGRLLFFDPILSGNKDVACATCHHPDFAFSENLDVSIGVNGTGLGSSRAFGYPNDIPLVKRNSQTVLNAAFNGLTLEQPSNPAQAPMFWDLRAKSLEAQALMPIQSLEEMRGRHYTEQHILGEVVKRLQRIEGYQTLFKAAFGGDAPINTENLGKAIATYERTLVAGNSRFDQYFRGDKTALSLNEIDGLKLFLKSGCAKCHRGPMLSDYKTHVLGVGDNPKLSINDDGFEHQHAFRTPSLRNLRFTFPYMHNGTIKSLEQVLAFYEDLAGGQIRNPKVKPAHLDPLLDDLNVDFKDISLIVEFLHTLSDDKFDRSIPERVPSGLSVGGNIKD